MAAELLLVQSQLEKARQDLRHVEEGIKKTSVRDPTYGFGDRLGGRGGRRGGGMVRPQRTFQREESPPKHKISSVASRLGPVLAVKKVVDPDEEDEEETPTLKSSVIQSTGPTELTREAAVPVDKATVQRSRRLFGSLLMGTLKQFKQDKAKTKEQEDKQAVVLDKIQKKEVEQKVQSAAERKKLFQCKDGVKDEIKLLEEQMNVTEMKVACETERDKLVQFIQTKTSPPLFYLPKEHNKKSEAALKESTVRVKESYSVRIAEFDSKLSTLKTRIEDVQQAKDAIESALTTPIKKESDPLSKEKEGEKENDKEDKKANKETGIKIEVQLRSKEENGHSKENKSKDKKSRHSSASGESSGEGKSPVKKESKSRDKKRRHSTSSVKSEKEEAKSRDKTDKKRRHSTTSEKEDKEEKEEVVTKSSSESSSGESSAEEEKEKSPVKKSKKSPRKSPKKSESKKSPRKESKSPRKRVRRSSRGKEE